jgi:hypothetical protein
MKVLLYTVFKDLRVDPSKLNSAVLTETPIAGAAQKMVSITIPAGISDHTLEMSDRFLDARLVCGRLECTPLRSWRPRSNGMYSLERR